MKMDDSFHPGHRDRLRQNFLNDPYLLSEKEFLELLLTYAIPRKDTALLAEELLIRFGSLPFIFSAPPEDLSVVPGLGDASVTFLKIINSIMARSDKEMTYQPDLFTPPPKKPVTKTQKMHVFANDEISNSLQHLPMAGDYSTFASYKAYLESHLPYNSMETRHRRANYILDRFYPDRDLNNSLTLFTQRNKSTDALKSVVFYHLAKAEPLLARVANDLVYPALPMGRIGKEHLKEFIASQLPRTKSTSQTKVLHSTFNSYALLNVGHADSDGLKFQLHSGNLAAFIYILASEYPAPGIYSFDTLYESPAHRWLLWDREWIRKQLYLLRDIQIVSKVSEIDTIKQFSLEYGQRECLERYFAAGDKNSYDKRNGG